MRKFLLMMVVIASVSHLSGCYYSKPRSPSLKIPPKEGGELTNKLSKQDVREVAESILKDVRNYYLNKEKNPSCIPDPGAESLQENVDFFNSKKVLRMEVGTYDANYLIFDLYLEGNILISVEATLEHGKCKYFVIPEVFMDPV